MFNKPKINLEKKKKNYFINNSLYNAYKIL